MLKHLPPPTNPGGQQRSVRGRPQQPLNVSALSAASLVSTPPATLPNQPPPLPPTNHSKSLANGGPRLSTSVLNNTNATHTPLASVSSSTNLIEKKQEEKMCTTTGAKEALTSLGLLCLALLSLIFLLKISPNGREMPPGPTLFEDYTIVYDVTLALCALSLSLNLCCLLVCAIQFLFAVKLVKANRTTGRTNKYLQKSSISRACAVGGFFISIPIFLTGIILYTFTQFQSTPAIITSILIGLGIVFCGAAIVHNVFVWQKEKTICVRQAAVMSISNVSTTSALLGNQTLLTPITPPMQFLNHNGGAMGMTGNGTGPQVHNHGSTPISALNTANLLHLNQNHMHLMNGMANGSSNHHTPLPITPLSANHSHLSFNNHSILAGYNIRHSAATPQPLGTSVSNLLGRDASGSVSPGNLDISTATTSNSQHELSTLV